MAETEDHPAPSGTVKVPGFGNVKKKTAAIGGVAAVGLVMLYIVVRRRQTAASGAGTGTGGQVTDPAGNVCAGPLDPNSGYCPGSAQDSAYYSNAGLALGGGLGGTGQGGGGTTTTGLPTGPGTVGPGSFSNNAEWAQYAEQYMGSNGADSIAAALGKYITGGGVTADQQTIIDEAVAIANYPPVQGPGGRPPGINLIGGPHPPPPPPPTERVTVPNVTGERVENATSALDALGLKPTFGTRKPGKPYTVTGQTPRAGTKVKKGSVVHLTIKEGMP